MQIRHLSIRHFRSIEELSWTPCSRLSCLIGPGDAGKSTILDAIEATLSPRWVHFGDADFMNGDTSRSIEIKVTVGELPPEAIRENRMGLHLRGWGSAGELHDEPEGDDEAVVTVRLTVDPTLEPVWELVTDRGEPKTLSAKDRALFGVVRLGADVERHLTWGHGSALARLSNEKGKASPLLAEAYRKARELISSGSLPWLDEIASKVYGSSVELGAYSSCEYSTGLDTQRASMSLGTLALHAGVVPIRLSGLGTRRLVALAIERLSIPEGALILIDELEHGLEPHRIRQALKILRAGLSTGEGEAHIGQVILTTHSPVTVVELSCDQLCVTRRDGTSLRVKSPSSDLQGTVRRVPEAFLSRRAIVCEGKTEVGLLRGLRDEWASHHKDEPIEYRGVVLVDGCGKQAPATAIELGGLGYAVCLFRDSDVALTTEEARLLRDAGIKVFEWPDGCATEHRVFRDVSDADVQSLLNIAFEAKSQESVLGSIRTALGLRAPLSAEFASWTSTGKTLQECRQAIGIAAHKSGWFKQIEPGERLGAVIASRVQDDYVFGSSSPLTTVLSELESWAYA